MNILIMGCSFGVPGQYPGCVVTDHTEHQLRSFGHNVHNVSQCAGSNINSLIRAKKFLSGESIVCPHVQEAYSDDSSPKQVLTEPFKVDWIVWFHTELARESLASSELARDLRDPKRPRMTIDQVSCVVYSQYFDFVKSLEAKLAVIGGAGPVHPTLYKFGNPEFCIDSWINKILNLDLPQIQTLSRPEMINQLNNNGKFDQKLKVIDQHLTILKALEDSEDFPDNYHPGGRPHRELANLLHKRFTE
jgi:hypothetical protein